MERNSYYAGLEISSGSVRLVVGYVLNGAVCLLHAEEAECDGLEDGLIMDPEAVSGTIRTLVNAASGKLNFPIGEVALALPPFRLTCMSDTGATNTVDSNDVVNHVDVTNIITAMKKRHLSDEDLKIIDVVPDSFVLNSNERYSTEPIGKISQVISLHASLYAMSNKVVRQFVACAEAAGVKVKYKVVAPYAAALYLSTFAQVPESYLLIDIGRSLTTVAQVHNRTTIVHSAIATFGGHSITQSVAETLGITYDDAEDLKKTFGIDSNPNFPVYIRNQITFDDLSNALIKAMERPLEELRSIIRSFSAGEATHLPIVLIGGGSELYHIESLFADELNLNVMNFAVDTLGARRKSMVVSLGLLQYWEVQPKVNEAEQVTASVTRVDTKKIKKNMKEDEIL